MSLWVMGQVRGHGWAISGSRPRDAGLYMFGLRMNPQQALGCPESFAHDGVLQLEGRWAMTWRQFYKHATIRWISPHPIGGGHAMINDIKTGIYTASFDSRKDGMAVGY